MRLDEPRSSSISRNSILVGHSIIKISPIGYYVLGCISASASWWGSAFAVRLPVPRPAKAKSHGMRAERSQAGA